ncbi:hypothetical protein ACVJGD_008731 [Bradyrhizobium sp. USDA 10063]
MISTIALAILVIIMALIYIAGQTYCDASTRWRINPAQLFYSRIVLICLGFGVAALLNSFPN